MLVIVGLILASISICLYSYWKVQPNIADDIGVVPVPESYDYTKVEPEVFRPFRKPNKTYKWSMSLRNITANDLFIIDKDYLALIALRKKALQNYPEITMGYHESCVPVIKEFYFFVLHYLLKRYPMYFSRSKTHVLNELTQMSLPWDIKDVKTEQLLSMLGQTITEDFLMLLDNNPDQPNEYCFRGFTGCAPGGVDNSARLNKPITRIHEPIPGFLDKLQPAMVKFFNRLQPTQFMCRNNWFIQYSNPPQMFFFIGESERTETHPMSLDNIQSDKRRLNPRKLDFNQIFFRNEKQSFLKLRNTNAAMMIVKTYLTPLTMIRDDEQLGLELCEAIDGIQGNPRDYKGVDSWGECMKSYLRGETNGITDEKYDYQFEY